MFVVQDGLGVEFVVTLLVEVEVVHSQCDLLEIPFGQCFRKRTELVNQVLQTAVLVPV